jgi:hypothetical protein
MKEDNSWIIERNPVLQFFASHKKELRIELLIEVESQDIIFLWYLF